MTLPYLSRDLEAHFDKNIHKTAFTLFSLLQIKDETESGQSLLALLSNCSTGNNLELSSADPEESEMHFWQKEGTKIKVN